MRFKNDNGKVIQDLYDKEAKKIAKKFVDYDGRNGVSRNQLRKIFDEVKRFEKILEIRNNWDEIFPQIKMIKSKVAYNVARAKDKNYRSNKQYNELKNFIEECIDNIKKADDYKIFCLLFEAVYGFYYELSNSRTN